MVKIIIGKGLNKRNLVKINELTNKKKIVQVFHEKVFYFFFLGKKSSKDL